MPPFGSCVVRCSKERVGAGGGCAAGAEQGCPLPKALEPYPLAVPAKGLGPGFPWESPLGDDAPTDGRALLALVCSNLTPPSVGCRVLLGWRGALWVLGKTLTCCMADTFSFPRRWDSGGTLVRISY